jgi:hypothetical protein
MGDDLAARDLLPAYALDLGDLGRRCDLFTGCRVEEARWR